MYSRTTTSGMYGTLLGSLQDSLSHIQDLQRQLATNNKYAKLSDNPTAVTRGLELESTLAATEKYMQNGQNAISMLNYSEGALNTVLDAAQSIRDLVIQAGNGGLGADELQDIVHQIEAKRQTILDALNSKVAGQYIFGGTDTSTPPFSMTSDGRIVYNGSDERIKYALGDGLLGDVSFTGSEIIPTDENTYFICSHRVPLDWEWTGREEKVQITVGNRTLAVFIPEQWVDELTDKREYTDYNSFRDPGELSGISLDDLASLVNRSLQEQGADMLVTATVEKDMATGEQQMFIKSNTGEKVGITGWTDTDYMPTCAQLMSKSFATADGTPHSAFPTTWQADNSAEKYNGLMGKTSVLSWRGGTDTNFTITLNDKDHVFDLTSMNSISDLVNAINKEMPVDAGDLPVACTVSGNLVLQSTKGKITVSSTNVDMKALFGTDNLSLSSSNSSLTVTLNNDTANATKIYINDGDDLTDIADKLHSIEGVFARTSSDKTQLAIVAQRVGDLPSDPLHVDEAEESKHYPSIQIEGKGAALALFDFNVTTDAETGVKTGAIGAEHLRRFVDHSHMDVFDVLGMETAMKSVEFSLDETLKVEDGKPLHWRVMSGGHTADITINPGEYNMTDLATRLKNAGAGWLEVTVDVVNPNSENKDEAENLPNIWGSFNNEAATQRLVIRGYNGEQVLFLDMNEQHYADKLGLSTALRTEAYTEGTAGTGIKEVYFPQAPCVDDKLGVTLRVQMNCGMTYDVNITKKAVSNPATGLVDRRKVMEEIVKQVNAQEGEKIMDVTIPVDDKGKELDGYASIYFLSGESFTVVDMPFSDPVWDTYSGGIAAQMGIHGGVTANMGADKIFKDSSTMLTGLKEALTEGKIKPTTLSSLTSVSGTIRFSNLAHSVEIDVGENDTVKDVMDRLRSQAGDWLYVNYFDSHMGGAENRGGRQSGDYPIIAISSKDGAAVSITDVNGSMTDGTNTESVHLSELLGLSTGIQGYVSFYKDDGTFNDAANLDSKNYVFSITVAGYTHQIDTGAMRDSNNNGKLDVGDLVDTINSRMQDYDVRAELNKNGELVLWSPRGYSIEVNMSEVDGVGTVKDPKITKDFFGEKNKFDVEVMDATSGKISTYYRGGYNLEASAKIPEIKATGTERTSPGIHGQNATIRSGANTTRQNAFGMLNDVIAAVKSGNRDALVDKMLPRVDAFINNILGVMSTNGALVNRYDANMTRQSNEALIMTDEHDKLVKPDYSEVTSQLMLANYVYQANLAVISRLIQPSLLDFLS